MCECFNCFSYFWDFKHFIFVAIYVVYFFVIGNSCANLDAVLFCPCIDNGVFVIMFVDDYFMGQFHFLYNRGRVLSRLIHRVVFAMRITGRCQYRRHHSAVPEVRRRLHIALAVRAFFFSTMRFLFVHHYVVRLDK